SDDDKAQRMQPGEVRIWTVGTGRLEYLLPLPACQVKAIEFIPQSDQLVVAGWLPGKGGMLSLWDAAGGKHRRDLGAGTTEVLAIGVSPDGRVVASGDALGNLDLWDAAKGTKIHSHKHDRPLKAVAFSNDGKLLATADDNRTVRVFDASGRTIERTL